MIIPRPNIRYILLALLLIILLATGAVLTASRFLKLDTYRGQIIAELERSLGRRVSYERGDLTFRLIPSFTFTGIEVKDVDGSSTFAKAERLTFQLAILPLLRKEIRISDLILRRPYVNIIRYQDGRLNIDDLRSAKREETQAQLDEIQVHEGTLRFTDLAATGGAQVTTLTEWDFQLRHLTRGKSSTIKLSGRIAELADRNSVSLNGKVRLPVAGESLAKTDMDLKTEVRDLTIDRYWPYLAPLVPFRGFAGTFDLDASLRGTPASFSSQGTIKTRRLRIDYPGIFKVILTPREVLAKYVLERTPQKVDVKLLDLSVDGVTVKANCAIRDLHTSDPRITAHAITSPFDFSHVAGYVPYGVITKDVADYIEQHVKGGIFRLDQGRIDGRVSQIANMGKGTNYNVLFVSVRVEKGVVSYGPSVPPFRDIKGLLELKGKDFTLTGMTGWFGTSPLTLDGKITDYPPTPTPCGFPFTMMITPHLEELTWLIGQERARRFSYQGKAPLKLSGQGFTTDYHLNGDWDLTAAAYTFEQLVKKPQGKQNSLSFALSFDRNGVKVNRAQYRLASVDLAGKAEFPSNDKFPQTIELQSNRFRLEELAELSPRLQPYQSRGTFQTTLRAKGIGKVDDLLWDGTMTLAGVSCKPPPPLAAVTDVNGTLGFGGSAFKTSQLTARIGTTLINGRGSLNGFSNPDASIAFSSPVVDLADFGIIVPASQRRLENVSGNVTFADNDLQIKSLAGQVNRTALNLKGEIRNLKAPQADLTVTASHLDAADLIALAGAKRADQPATNGQFRVGLKAAITADSGSFKGLEFRKLSTVMHYDEGILYLQPVELQALGGRCSGRLRADLGSAAGPRYQASFNLEKISSEDTQRYLDSVGLRVRTGITTGQLTLSGDLTAKGEAIPDLKRSLLGTVKIHQERGMLHKYGTLSKVFSILNVSQLFKFKLPDMVSGGMPYNEINATFAFKDGIVETQDALITSEAMNISFVGKVDLMREEIDALIGVQPLQTIDKVVNKIPIVGWILTGKDKSFVTTYFEAKGPITDPQVQAIPVSSISRGTMGIFKRIFQLPVKLFTDTGEVILPD